MGAEEFHELEIGENEDSVIVLNIRIAQLLDQRHASILIILHSHHHKQFSETSTGCCCLTDFADYKAQLKGYS